MKATARLCLSAKQTISPNDSFCSAFADAMPHCPEFSAWLQCLRSLLNYGESFKSYSTKIAMNFRELDLMRSIAFILFSFIHINGMVGVSETAPARAVFAFQNIRLNREINNK